MPLPFFLIGAAVVSGIAGIVKGAESVSNNSEAQRLLSKARDLFETTKTDLENKKNCTTNSLVELGKIKLNVWDEQLGRFVHLFEQVKDVQIEGEVTLDNKLRSSVKDELLEMKEISLKAGEVVAGGVQALGAGTLAGVASYGGAMMFATASTGTAISTLSGVAATNATLAWFGGGSLAAGGLGMAGGVAVLGGLVTGPVIAVGGMLMAAKSRKNLSEAKTVMAEARVAVEEMKNAISMLDAINKISVQFTQTIKDMEKRMIASLDILEQVLFEANSSRENSFIFRLKKIAAKLLGKVLKIKYKDLNNDQQKALHVSYQFAQSIKLLLETPILTEQGALDDEAVNVLNANQKLLPS